MGLPPAVMLAWVTMWLSVREPVPPVKATSTDGGTVPAGSVGDSTWVPSTDTVTVWPDTTTLTMWFPLRRFGTLLEVAANFNTPLLVPVAIPTKLLEG